MEPSTILFAASFVLASIFGGGLLLVSVTLARRVPLQSSSNTSITTGNNAQVNLAQTGDYAQVTNGTYGDIQVYEDALTKLGKATDDLALIREIIAAVQQGRYQGDVTETFDELFANAEQHARVALFILKQGRNGEYTYRITERELSELYRKQRNGHT